MSLKSYRHLSQIVTLKSAHQKGGRNLIPEDLSIIEDAAIVFDDHAILWVGAEQDFPKQFHHATHQDYSGHTLVPELVDCHTHLVFGGDRAFEYSLRLNGASYEQLAHAGGGIIHTMEATNNLDSQELFKLAVQRIEAIASYGVGTIEIKSGYGLNYEKEKELTLVIDRLKKHFAPKIQIFNTYMAAHAVPPESKDSHSYMHEVVIPLLDELIPLRVVDAVDIFHERGYFDVTDLLELIKVAEQHQIPLKVHADEFYDNKGALLASSHKALSADHLLCTTEDGIEALANSETVATLLPGTGLFLGKAQAKARSFLNAGAKVAIASDYNPGSCHCDNVLLVASLAAPLYKMNLAELWVAITLNASHALGLNRQGAIIPGLTPRFTLFKTDSIDRITYNWGKNLAISPLI